MGTAKNAVGAIGKDEVPGPNPGSSSNFLPRNQNDFGAFCVFSVTFRRISKNARFSWFCKRIEQRIEVTSKRANMVYFFPCHQLTYTLSVRQIALFLICHLIRSADFR